MIHNDTKKAQKNARIFECSMCDFKCSKKCDWERHIIRPKHIKHASMIQNDTKSHIKNAEHINEYVCECGNIYKHHSGLWRHKNNGKCDYTNSTNETHSLAGVEITQKNEINELKEFMKYLMKENSEMKNLVLEQQNMMMKVIENGTTNNSHNTTNSHNKAFNLQFFLNETCKDAMNIMDFVESIQLQLSDLENVGELGYVEGISNIIVKNLKELDVTQRPVHCTDKKRETIYIKDENKWEKDDEKSKIRKLIKRVASKNQRLLLKFKELHPDCIKYHSKYSDQYNKLIVESMGGSGNNDLEKEDKIIRNIAKNVVVDKTNEAI